MELEKLQEIIAQVMGVDTREVTMETTFVDDLGADSLDMVEIVTAMEEEYGIDFPEEGAEHIITVGDAVEALKKILG